MNNVSTWLVKATIVFVAGCSAQAQSGNAPNPPIAAPGIDKACDVRADGWKAAPLEVPAELRSAAAAGEPVAIPVPPGYQHMPPRGVPYCDQRVRGNAWATRCATDADCPKGSLCPVDNADMKCEATCQTNADCTGGAVCLGRARKPSKLCTCAPPNWCDDLPPPEM
ncbi:MAG TPA: hypothetical protein VJR89_13805 [Polyangiales bacterium]|nr:hypothetical protein [Polyangiales bacterium]